MPLQTNFVINGTDITHTAGSRCINLSGGASGHCYLINYSVNANPLTNEFISVRLELNGTTIDGAGINQQAVPGTSGYIGGSGNGIVMVPAGTTQCLTIVNNTANPICMQDTRVTITETC